MFSSVVILIVLGTFLLYWCVQEDKKDKAE